MRRRVVLRREELFVERWWRHPVGDLVPFCGGRYSLILVALVLSLIFVTGLVRILLYIVPSPEERRFVLAIRRKEVMRTLLAFAPLPPAPKLSFCRLASLEPSLLWWSKIRSARLLR